MIKSLNINNYSFNILIDVIIDVRSEGEYSKGHIVGAINIPLFNDLDRAKVGTLYKKEGRKKAIALGLELLGPKLKNILINTEKQAEDKRIIAYCWRGGLRSNSFAWLMDMYGYNVNVINKGYKSYRKKVQEFFNNQFPFIVIGGKTGSGKTEVLHNLKANNYQVLDLEYIARHKGSAFGHLGQEAQFSNEHFENLLFDELSKFDLNKPIFTENESQSIGKNFIPLLLFKQIQNAPSINLNIDTDIRIKRLVNEYSCFEKEKIKDAIFSISKRLGGLNFKLSIEALENNDFETITKLSLQYYDKTYEYGLSLRDPQKVFNLENNNTDINSIIEIAKKII